MFKVIFILEDVIYSWMSSPTCPGGECQLANLTFLEDPEPGEEAMSVMVRLGLQEQVHLCVAQLAEQPWLHWIYKIIISKNFR